MQSVINALRVLEEVGRQQPVGVSELARQLALPKSSVQRALRTLHAAGWIRPAGSELTRWLLTTKALHVGWHAIGELSLREAAMPVMEQLRRQTEETIHLMVPEGNRVVLIERLETPKPVRIIIPLGGGAPIHASSNGKVILAHSPPVEVERVIAEGLPRYTDTTIVDPDELRAELAATRVRGYATNSAEWRSDIAAVAAAILNVDGHPVGSLSISTPAVRMPAEVAPQYGRLVRDAARRITASLGQALSP
ncbi:MAG: helix-turn-helix domain-containing protein [Streptosporangiales bacterium]|nr:helix-turn-helix domain-containing protein [Streptosporangiales bacterium]